MTPAVMNVVRYLISGGIAALVDLGSLYACVDVFHMWYLAAATIAFILTLIVSFTLQKWWTFAERSTTALGAQLSSYIALSIANIFVNAALMYVFVDVLHIQYLVAQIGAIAVIAFYGFFLYRHWIFKPR